MLRYLLQLIYYCLTFSLICVGARAGNPVNILYFYPPAIQDRVFELGLTSKQAMAWKRNVVLPVMVIVMGLNLFLIIRIWNGAQDFKTAFYQALFFLQAWNIYDGVVMDKVWPEKSNFWIIPEIKELWAIPDWFSIFKRRLAYVPGLLVLALLAAKLCLLF